LAGSSKKVKNPPDWTLFRFAQGAPDKATRFDCQFQKIKNKKPLEYPTLLGWHGSPLRNWLSIVRTGLCYDNIQHGRSFGNGIYFAKEFCTSAFYARAGGVSGA
jgi:ubiquitin-conjugating enzyme E2 Q